MTSIQQRAANPSKMTFCNRPNMADMEATVLKQESAAEIIADWLKHNAPQQQKYKFSQRRWIMEQIAKQAVAETIKNGGNAYELERYLTDAAKILDSLWYETAPEYAKNWFRKDDEPEPDEKTKENVESAQNRLWQRRDPLRAFNDGYESEHHFEHTKDVIHRTVAAYLKRSWLRHPFLDWVFMDVMTTGELCAYGEALKQKFIPGRKDCFGMHTRYFKAKGNLAEMRKFDWKETTEGWWTKFCWFAGFPVGAIWAAFHYNWETAGGILLALYSLIIALFLAFKIWRLVKIIFNAVRGKPDPKTVPFELWKSMYQAWRCLEGPIVNPSILRETMRKSAEKGAVWDAPSLALLDRIISHDPAVWIVAEIEGEAA